LIFWEQEGWINEHVYTPLQEWNSLFPKFVCLMDHQVIVVREWAPIQIP